MIIFIDGAGSSSAAAVDPGPEIKTSVVTSLIWPISGSTTPDSASVSSPFGPRWQASKSRYDYHPGIDIAAPANTPIHAVDSGTVYSVGWSTADSGLMVVIYHPSRNLYSAYLHLNSASVIAGQSVAQGDVIGLVGDTGTTDFMHLHFEIRLTPGNYPASTRNPMGYLPHPELGAPTIQISNLNTSPIYSPTVSLAISTTRQEIDLNQVRVILQDRVTGAVLDDQMVDFNQRLHTGSDTLDQDGIQLTPSHYNTSTLEYQLAAKFNNLHGADSFTLTAQAVDTAGNMSQVVAEGMDTTPPGEVTSLTAYHSPNGGVDLSWLAPGDSDGLGTASTYDIRYATQPINSSVWDSSAMALPNPPIPVSGGRWQTWLIPSPLPVPLYFALRAVDDEGNLSPISNSAPLQFPVFLPFAIR